MMFERLPALEPLHFFSISLEGAYLKENTPFQKKHLLPSTFKYFNQEEEAKVFFGFNEKGLRFQFQVFTEVKEVVYPDYRKGDSIELFIDTRNLQSAGYITKFCHHFVLFPSKVEGFFIKEVTRFRNDDAHFLAESKDFQVEVDAQKKFYLIDVFIPSFSLHGYDISKFDKLGFTYRINITGRDPINFSLSPKEFVIERNPYFWSTLTLKNE
jgi:hypothetical protein